MKKIWMLVGDEYDLVAKNEDTPCRLKDGSMLSLREAVDSGKEGNHYTPLSGFWCGSYIPETSYTGEVYYSSMEGDPDPEDVRIPGENGAVEAIILSPTW